MRSEPASLEQGSRDVVREVPEPERGPAEVLEPAIDRLGRPVRGSRVIEVGEDVSPAPVKRVAELAQLDEPGWRRRFHGVDQFP